MSAIAKDFFERNRIISGALGIVWNEGYESNLIQLLFTRREAARQMMKVPEKSITGEQCMQIIEFCNGDIKKLLAI